MLSAPAGLSRLRGVRSNKKAVSLIGRVTHWSLPWPLQARLAGDGPAVT